MKKKTKEKQFIVRKYIMADNALQAIRKDKKTPVHDVWLDEEWKKLQPQSSVDAIGYTHVPRREEE